MQALCGLHGQPHSRDKETDAKRQDDTRKQGQKQHYCSAPHTCEGEMVSSFHQYIHLTFMHSYLFSPSEPTRFTVEEMSLLRISLPIIKSLLNKEFIN